MNPLNTQLTRTPLDTLIQRSVAIAIITLDAEGNFCAIHEATETPDLSREAWLVHLSNYVRSYADQINPHSPPIAEFAWQLPAGETTL